MRLTVLAPFLLGLALAACQNVEWSHPQYGTSRAQADLSDCDHLAARESTRSAFAAEPLMTAPHVSRLSSGQIVADPAPRYPYGSAYPNPGDLRSYCMRSKGYELVPKPD